MRHNSLKALPQRYLFISPHSGVDISPVRFCFSFYSPARFAGLHAACLPGGRVGRTGLFADYEQCFHFLRQIFPGSAQYPRTFSLSPSFHCPKQTETSSSLPDAISSVCSTSAQQDKEGNGSYAAPAKLVDFPLGRRCFLGSCLGRKLRKSCSFLLPSFAGDFIAA